MKAIQKTLLGLCLASTLLSVQAFASEFDQYLQEKKILNSDFQIIDENSLNELLTVLSSEDSKTLPLEIDNNTIIEQLNLSAHQTELKGLIITPDFAQFETDLGNQKVEKIIRDNLLQNCAIFFEHQYQIKNPYQITLDLRSETKTYHMKISQQDCQ